MNASTRRGRTRGKGRFGKRWIIVGSAGIVAVLVVLVIVLLRLARPSLVTAGKLDSALLGTEQINTLMGTFGMQLSEAVLTPIKPTVALSRPDCLGALTAAQAPTYVDSGYTEFRWAEAKAPGDNVDHYVAQAVAIFPDVDKARAFVQNSADHWRVCADAIVIVMQADKSIEKWNIENVIGEPPSITVSEARRDIGWRCQRAMRAVSNAVIDATACGFDITDQGSAVADRIAANVSE
jgi:serine/threonine-protein kinase